MTDVELSIARYRLAAHLFLDLAGRNVRHVVVGSSVFLPPGRVYFQRLLGFEATRVDVVEPGRVTEPGSEVPEQRSVHPTAAPTPRHPSSSAGGPARSGGTGGSR